MPKIKRTLYMGLGGTGAKILLKIKKNFMESYGTIPPMVGFLIIDTDRNILSYKETTRNGIDVRMDNSELLYCTAQNAAAIYRQNRDMREWVPEQNVNSLTLIQGNGAGQVRSNGRFIAYFNHQTIIDRVKDAVTKIHRIPNIRSEFQLDAPVGVAPTTTINVMGSVAGGSGSGLIIDSICLIRTAIEQTGVTFSIYPWIILPEIFKCISDGPAMNNVFSNTYGALRELDYIHHHSQTKPVINFGHSQIESPIFDFAYIINNRNITGATVTNPEHLWESVAKSAFLPASDMGNDISSTFDNIKNIEAGGAYQIRDKRAWAASAGSAELIYDNQTVGHGYADRIIESICNYLTENSKTDPNALANGFFDRTDVMIRENNNRDDVIDSLIDPTAPVFTIDSNINAGDIENYINGQNGENFVAILNQNLEKKLNNTKSKLDAFISDIMQSQRGCVSLAISVIDQILSIADLCLGEMTDEEIEYQNINNETIDWYQELLACENRGLLRLRGKYDSMLIGELQMKVTERATNILEEKRRRWAITFYNDLKTYASDYKMKLYSLKSNIENAKANSLADLAKRQHNAIAPSPFHIYLHENALNKITFKLSDGDIAQFKNYIGNLSDLLGYEKNLLDNKLLGFAKTHETVKNAVNTSIDDVLRSMSKDEKEELMSVLRRLISLAEPLWVTNTMGYLNSVPNMDKFLVIGVNQKGSSFLESVTDKSIQDIITLPNHTTAYVSTQRIDRISVLMVQDLLPIFAIANVPVYKTEHDNRENQRGGSPIAYHLDSNFDARIKSDKFVIFPSEEDNNTLELWVLGFIFSHINYDTNNGQYWVKSLKRGEALRNYRYNLGTQRDVAYDTFRSMSIDLEIKTLMDARINDEGANSYLDEIRRVQNDDYLHNYSQISQPELLQIEQPNYRKIKQLITDEINFITNFKISDRSR